MLRLWHRIMYEGLQSCAMEKDYEEGSDEHKKAVSFIRQNDSSLALCLSVYKKIKTAVVLIADECGAEIQRNLIAPLTNSTRVTPLYQTMFVEFNTLRPDAHFPQYGALIERHENNGVHSLTARAFAGLQSTPDGYVSGVLMEHASVLVTLNTDGTICEIKNELGDLLSGVRELSSCRSFPIAVALTALGLCNCGNVTMIDGTANHGPSQVELNAIRIPKITYHVLKIRDNIRKIRPQDPIDDAPEKRGEHALHWVRGHFATYSKEKPLFGRLSGTFWIPEHARGDLKNGLVMKDYEVCMPEVNQQPEQSLATISSN